MGAHFDGTITLGNVITGISLLFFAIIAWRDLHWRIKFLEEWRAVHEVASLARDQLLAKVDRTLTEVAAILEERRKRRGE